MEPKKYPYSKSQNYTSIVLVLGLNTVFLYLIISSSNLFLSIVFGVLLLCMVALTVYICRKFFFPLLRHDTALELDNEKLQFYVDNKTIYWKDVKSINHKVQKNADWVVTFAFKNGSKDIDVFQKYIAGDDKAIYDTITEYFEKYK